MNIIIRLFAHTCVFLIYIYIFCYASNLFGSSWWNWLWFIATGLLIIVGFLFHYQIDFDSEDEDYISEQQPLIALISGFSIVSICLKILLHIPEASIAILILSICYIIELGFRRLSYSIIYGLMSLFLVWPYVNFHIWYEVIGFIILFSLAFFFIFISYINYFIDIDPDCTDDEHEMGFRIIQFVFGLVITFACLLFIGFKGSLLIQLSTDGYIYLLYFCIGLKATLRNWIFTSFFIVIATICFFFFISGWPKAIEWSSDGIYLIGVFSVALYSKMKWVILSAGIIWLGIIIAFYIKTGFRPILYNGMSMTCPRCRRIMVAGKPKHKLIHMAVKIGGGKAGSAAVGAMIGSFAGPFGAFIGKQIGSKVGGWLSNEGYKQAAYLNNGIKLHFKCPKCKHEWDRYETYGEIVRRHL